MALFNETEEHCVYVCVGVWVCGCGCVFERERERKKVSVYTEKKISSKLSKQPGHPSSRGGSEVLFNHACN